MDEEKGAKVNMGKENSNKNNKDNKDNKTTVTTITTTTTKVINPNDGVECQLWAIFILSILIALGSLGSTNWPTIAVGIMNALGAGILLFEKKNEGTRKIAFWILVASLVLEAIALVYLVSFGLVLFFQPGVWGFGFFFGSILLATAVPVMVVGVLTLIVILGIQPRLFQEETVTKKTQVTETVELPLLP